MAVNEVKNAVVRTAETILFQRRIRVGSEVAIGKKEKLGISDEFLSMTGIGGVLTGTIGAYIRTVGTRIAATGYAVGRNVSHVDIFGLD